MTDATFALGIDLGTTNSALASVPMADKTDSPQPLAIPQTVAPGETMAENLLPSFLYMSAEAERAAIDAMNRQNPEAAQILRGFALDLGEV